MTRLQDELALANALKQYHVTIFNGLTTFTERRDKARAAIQRKDLGASRNEKAKLTYAEMFLQAYAESL